MDPDERKLKIVELNKLASTIIQDPIYSNQIHRFIDGLCTLDSAGIRPGDDLYAETLIRCVSKIFCFYIDSREFVRSRNVDKTSEALNEYKSHLIRWYDRVIDELLKLFRHVEGDEIQISFNIKKLALTTLIKFVEEEGKFPFREVTNENEDLSFPNSLLSKIIRNLISETSYNQELIAIFVNYYQYDDFIHFTLKNLIEIIDSFRNTENLFVMQNIIDFIFPIRLITPADLAPKVCAQPEIEKVKRKRKKSKSNGVTGEHKTWMRLCEMQPYANCKNRDPIILPSKKFKFDYERDAGLYASVWLKYLQFNLQPTTYKRALLYLDKHAIQHFANPLLLADFLIDSFKTGGIISLLSLSPLYTLIHKCNLDYPHFFDNLYGLLQPAITYVRYRARFLFWCDLFLTSTHISAQVVASFAKRLARLALTSPPDTILIVLPFVGNLFIRHPVIQSLLIAKQFDPEKDPFDDAQPNPEKTNAIHSYMWELKALQSHYLPEIAELSKQISTDLPSFEWNLCDILETDMDDVIDNAKKTMIKTDKYTYDLSCDLFYAL